MPLSTMKRVYVPKFCELCGKEEFEGIVFGRESVRHLHAQHDTRRIVCDHCANPPRTFRPLAAWFYETTEETE
jgi:hypothetical protein